MKREEAIAILDGFKHNPLFNEQHFEALDMAISALSAPSANVISIDQANAMIKSYVSHYEENKGEWIPVTERLPYPNMRILICDDCEDVMQSFLGNDGRFIDTWGEEIKNVLAWQPLPEPYKAESEDKE